MRYVAAYLLAVLGGNESPGEADIKKILSSVGIDVDGDCVKKVIGELKGKNLEELIAAGRQKMSAMPSASAASAAPAAAAATTAAQPAKETKKEEEKKEEEEEEDEDMGFGLFD